MNWCQKHWDELRAEVTRQGLMGLVATDGNRVAENLVRELEGDESPDTFDPLMGAMWAMNSFMTGPVGLSPLFLLTSGECPICFIDKEHLRVCTDDPCDYGSIAKFFVNAVADQKKEWERRTA